MQILMSSLLSLEWLQSDIFTWIFFIFFDYYLNGQIISLLIFSKPSKISPLFKLNSPSNSSQNPRSYILNFLTKLSQGFWQNIFFRNFKSKKIKKCDWCLHQPISIKNILCEVILLSYLFLFSKMHDSGIYAISCFSRPLSFFWEKFYNAILLK
jgi:hypothetical protein